MIEALLEKIDDTYAEAFDGLFSRLLVTGERGLTKKDTNSPFLENDPLRFAAYRATATPSTVVGRVEAGIEKWLSKNQTPDGREGVVIQYWGMYDREKSLKEQVEKFYKEMSIRIRQDILSASGGTTRIFNWMKPKEIVYEIDSEERIGKCGGGYETAIEEYGRKAVSVPLMMGHDFVIDNPIGCGIGISGANFWIFCDNIETGRKAGKASIEAIKKVDKVITSFYVCPSGSMVKDYPPIGPPTNYSYCPSLRNKILDSKVPEGVNSIPEIVIDGTNLTVVENAMREGILAAIAYKEVKMISAGNYEGKLGQHKINLRGLFSK
jgi:formylmethanofuran--tetrahydromethanopterin N-formyltransferase